MKAEPSFRQNDVPPSLIPPNPQTAKSGGRRRERSGRGSDLKLPFYEPNQIGNGGSNNENPNEKILEIDFRENIRHFASEERKGGHRSCLP